MKELIKAMLTEPSLRHADAAEERALAVEIHDTDGWYT